MTGAGKAILDRPVEAAERRARYEEGYRQLFGSFPESVRTRWNLAETHERLSVPEALEEIRAAAILDSPLGLKVQQLVHFGQLVALGRQHPASIHAGAALRAGASIDDLLAVAETALITSGVPGYGLAIEIIAKLADGEPKI